MPKMVKQMAVLSTILNILYDFSKFIDILIDSPDKMTDFVREGKSYNKNIYVVQNQIVDRSR